MLSIKSQPSNLKTMTSPLVSTGFSSATAARRTIHMLDSTSPVSDAVVTQLAKQALLEVPSAFNNQATRITLLFGEDHKKLWSITGDTLLAKIGEKRWNEGTKDRISGFAAAHGTILFWDDSNVVSQLSESAPDMYKDKINEWIHQANGMHQYYLWTGLAALGCGVNLQHYNPLIDEEVQKTWNLPSEWKLRAQMVFGTPTGEPREKEQKLPIEKRLQAFGTSSETKSEL